MIYRKREPYFIAVPLLMETHSTRLHGLTKIFSSCNKYEFPNGLTHRRMDSVEFIMSLMFEFLRGSERNAVGDENISFLFISWWNEILFNKN